MIKFKTLRHALMMTAATLGGTVVATVADRPAYAQEAVRAYAIPAQDLDDALRAFAMQTGRDVLYPPQVVAGKRSPGVQGQRTERQALAALLVGTGLRFEQTASNGYVVQDPGSPTRAGEAGEVAASELEDVVVTGTNIRGGVPVGSPVLVFTAEDIERSGAQTAAQFMDQLPQNFGGGISLDTNSTIGDEVSASNQTDPSRVSIDRSFGSSVNLRGLGQGTTLILVNGRRLASAAAQSNGRPYTDISSIPLSAVESIQVLTDGASAIYGADAVGGVVNFILKRDYVGAQTRLTVGVGSDGEGREYRGAQTVGFGWASGNLLASYEHYEREAITAESRPLFDEYIGDSGTVSGMITPDETADSLSISLSQTLMPNLSAFADLAYNERETLRVAQSVFDYETIFPGFGFGLQTVDSKNVGNNRRSSAVVGLDAELGGTWTARLVGGLSRDSFRARDDSLTVAPDLGINSPTTLDTLARSELATLDATVSGTLFTLPAGPVRLAVGAQHRADTYDYEAVDNAGGRTVQNPDTVHTNAAFAEIQAPLLRPLDRNRTPLLALSLAGRYEEYDNFGNTFDPLIGLRLAPSDNLQFRATYNTSFKPPSVQQLQPPTIIAAVYRSSPSEPDGFRRSIEIFGGNPDLQPEVSRNWTAGFEWTIPSQNNLRIEGTFYDIEYRDRISVISSGTNDAAYADPLLDSVRILRTDLPGAEFDALVSGLLANPYGTQFSGCNAATPFSIPPVIFGACSEPVSNFEAIAYRDLRNLAMTHDRGVDLTLSQDFDTDLGRFDWTVSATYIIDHEQQFTETGPVVERVSQLHYPIDLNVRAGIGWESGAWSLNATIDYADSYENTQFTPSRQIDAYTTVDFSAKYRVDGSEHAILNGASLLFYVQNVFEEEPPRIEYPSTNGRVIPYDPNNANLDLRRFSVTLVKEW